MQAFFAPFWRGSDTEERQAYCKTGLSNSCCVHQRISRSPLTFSFWQIKWKCNAQRAQKVSIKRNLPVSAKLIDRGDLQNDE